SAIEVLDIIAWPAVVVWLGYLFRTQLPEALKDAVKRGFEVAFGGVKVAVSAALPAQTPPPPTEGVSAVPRTDSPQPTPPAADTALLPPQAQQYVASVRSYFSADQLEPQLRAVRNDLLKIAGADLTSQVEALVYSLASANLQLGHERVYSAIYGSQLR